MDMNVLGIPQIYAYIIGWSQYDLLWALIRDTGLFYIPIIVIFARSVLNTFLSQETRSGGVTAVKRLSVYMLYLIVYVFLIAVPCVYINVNGIKFEGIGNQKANATYNHNNSTYKDHLPSDIHQGQEVVIPLAWYLFLNLSNAITGSMFSTLATPTLTARQTQQDLAALSIKDPKIKAEYYNFLHDCYEPAYADYQAGNYPLNDKKAIENLNSKYGQTNLNFAGSKVLEKYFYKNYQAQRIVAGFPFDAKRDEVYAQGKTHPKYGAPMCNNWWLATDIGLQDRMYKYLEKEYAKKNGGMSLYDGFHRLAGSFARMFGHGDYEDAIIQNYLYQMSPSGGGSSLSEVFGSSTGYYTENSQLMTSNPASQFESKAGLIWNDISSFESMITTLVNALPLIQMWLLVVVFAIIPLGIVVSMFRFSFILSAMCFVFAVIFCTYLWHLVSYIDNFFIASFYAVPQSNNSTFESFYAAVANIGTVTLNTNVILVNMVAGIMYVIAPSVFIGMLTWAGASVGGVLDSAMSRANTKANEVGNDSIKGLSKVATLIK